MSIKIIKVRVKKCLKKKLFISRIIVNKWKRHNLYIRMLLMNKNNNIINKLHKISIKSKSIPHKDNKGMK
jgi:hypothetical protein